MSTVTPCMSLEICQQTKEEMYTGAVGFIGSSHCPNNVHCICCENSMTITGCLGCNHHGKNHIHEKCDYYMYYIQKQQKKQDEDDGWIILTSDSTVSDDDFL